MYIVYIEIDKQNEYIQKHSYRQYMKEKKRKEILLEMSVGSLDHLDNWKSFGVYTKSKDWERKYS